jgi:hypothetical protein
VIAVASDGADRRASTMEMKIRTSTITSDCQRKIVSENGMTPVICSSDLGKLDGLACSSAADEPIPSAQVAPRPR